MKVDQGTPQGGTQDDLEPIRFTLRAMPSPSRANAVKAIWSAPNDWEVEIKAPTRSSEQNKLMWVVLQQLTPVPWYGEKLTKEEWKEMITAGLKQNNTRTVPGIGGGLVVIGASTRKMTKKQMSEVIEYAYWFGANHGVVFTDPAENYRSAS